jgi:hypothetical protein
MTGSVLKSRYGMKCVEVEIWNKVRCDDMKARNDVKCIGMKARVDLL